MATTQAAALKVESPSREALRMFLRSKVAIVGSLMLLAILLLTFFGPMLYPVDPLSMVAAPFTPPWTDSTVLLGSDHLGRDILAGIVNGGRMTLIVGASAAILSVLIGITMGALSGFYGGRIDALLMRVTEFFQVLPALLFAMVVVTLFRPTLVTIAIAIGVVSWTGVARLTRAEFLKLKTLEFVTAERAAGAGVSRLIWFVILPNALAPLDCFGHLRDRRSDPVRGRSVLSWPGRSQCLELGPA